jgi:hypothetical protein
MLMAAMLTAGVVKAQDFEFETDYPKEKYPKEEFRSPGTATGMSVAGFLVPIGLTVLLSTGDSGAGGESPSAVLGLTILTGSIFGPGLGHVYAGETGRFWKGAGLRTLSWGGFIAAMAMSWDNPNAEGASGIAFGSIGLYLVSSIYDMAKASDSAKRFNEKAAHRQAKVAPFLVPEENAAGVMVSIGF